MDKLAVIKYNKPYCPVCDIELGRLTGEYDCVEHDGETYTKFERFCNGKCHGKYVYFADIRYNETKRYIFTDSKVIKDEG